MRILNPKTKSTLEKTQKQNPKALSTLLLLAYSCTVPVACTVYGVRHPSDGMHVVYAAKYRLPYMNSCTVPMVAAYR